MFKTNTVCAEKKKFEWRNWFVYFVLIGLIVVFAVLNKVFLTAGNFESIGRQTAMVSIIAFGATFVITMGHIDLSVGALVGLVGVVAAMCLRAGLGIPLASALGILTGVAFGFANGILVAKARIPAFLVTLGTMGIARGLALTVTNTKAVIITDEAFTQFWGAGSIGGLPISIIWTVVLFVFAIWLYHYTAFGNYVKAAGGNKTAAIYSGVKVDKITIWVFVLAGMMAAIAGLIMAARLKSGRPEVGDGMELDAVAAVILGGTALSGGRGKMVNTLIGSLIMGVIVNGLIIMGVQTNIQEIIKGIIIIAAVSLSEKQ
jgi:ribose transport system permease protein